MKAVVYHPYRGPEPGILELAEVAPPKVHVDSVLVRVHAAAVNPAIGDNATRYASHELAATRHGKGRIVLRVIPQSQKRVLAHR
ncbi:hypothetical protein ACSMXN_20790 [Jatrophihabitans sp. DSM 45814]